MSKCSECGSTRSELINIDLFYDCKFVCRDWRGCRRRSKKKFLREIREMCERGEHPMYLNGRCSSCGM